MDGDVCPICKSSRYLNPDMKFKVSTECYHKMCESCVDRLFSLGPATCPFATCHKTLRKNKFTDQKFEDIQVEKEVNIRGRVMRLYNRGEEHFSSLKEYNDYLEDIERIVFNLVNGIDVEVTEQELQDYERQNKEEIRKIDQQRVEESRKQAALERIEQERRQERLELERQREQLDRELKQQEEKDFIRQLATTEGNADEIEEQIRRQAEQRRKEEKRKLRQQHKVKEKLRTGANRPTVTGAQRAIGANGTPFTPFNGDRQKEYLFSVQEDYYDPLLNDLTSNKHYTGSGFKIQEAYQQALVQAFFGLGCNIQAEKQPPLETIQEDVVN